MQACNMVPDKAEQFMSYYDIDDILLDIIWSPCKGCGRQFVVFAEHNSKNRRICSEYHIDISVIIYDIDVL